MKVFVTGATGYIGFEVANEIRRSGFDVYGLARSDKGAALLERFEIVPLHGDLNDLAWLDRIEKEDVVIHCAFENPSLDKKFIQAILQKRLTQFIYTSGIWVKSNLQLVQWRITHEQMLATHPRTLIIRPGIVYGGKGGLFSLFFAGGEKGEVEVIGDGNNTWSMIHVVDLAKAYLKAFEMGVVAKALDITDGSPKTVQQIAQSVAELYNCPIKNIPKEEAVKRLGTLAEGLLDSQVLDNFKEKEILKWSPKHTFIEDVACYRDSWRAYGI